MESVPDLHLCEPIWKSATTYSESVLFIQPSNSTPASANLLFDAQVIREVTSADHAITFMLGKDFQLSANVPIASPTGPAIPNNGCFGVKVISFTNNKSQSPINTSRQNGAAASQRKPGIFCR